MSNRVVIDNGCSSEASASAVAALAGARDARTHFGPVRRSTNQRRWMSIHNADGTGTRALVSTTGPTMRTPDDSSVRNIGGSRTDLASKSFSESATTTSDDPQRERT